MNTAAKVKNIVEPIVKDFGLKLWDIRFEKEGANWFLRIFIDKDSGINIEDCEKVSRAVDKPLDELDAIEQQYTLEVSSPGLERKLIKPEHYIKFLGADILIKTMKPIENIGKEFGGILSSYENGEIEILDHDKKNKIKLNVKDTVWVKLDDF